MANHHPAEQQFAHRRRAPALDAPVRTSYRGRLIKKAIERNRVSGIKRKYYKEVRRATQQGEGSTGQEDTTRQEGTTGQDTSGKDTAEEEGTAKKDTAKQRRATHGQEAAPKRHQRANPFGKALREREDAQKRRDEERQQRDLEIRRVEAQHRQSARQRKEQRKRHSARTARGQPVLSSQISGLLDKIQSSSSHL